MTTPSTNKCIKCGEEIKYGMTFTRNANGTAQHAPGDWCKPTVPSVCEHKNTFVSKSTRKGTRKICHECNAVLPKQPTPQQKEASPQKEVGWEERLKCVGCCQGDYCAGKAGEHDEELKSFIRTEIAQAEKRGEVRALEELIDDIDDKFVWAGDSHATSGGFEWLNKALTELIELIGRRIATLKAKTDE